MKNQYRCLQMVEATEQTTRAGKRVRHLRRIIGWAHPRLILAWILKATTHSHLWPNLPFTVTIHQELEIVSWLGILCVSPTHELKHTLLIKFFWLEPAEPTAFVLPDHREMHAMHKILMKTGNELHETFDDGTWWSPNVCCHIMRKSWVVRSGVLQNLLC